MNDEPKSIVVSPAQKTWPYTEEDEELFREFTAPIPEVFPEEFQRYLDLFYIYSKKKPFHARLQYGRGFLRQKGKKKSGDEFERGCYTDLIAKMLDHDRWKGLNPDKRHTEAYWIALYSGVKSSLKAIDIDNKQNIFGYYRPGRNEDQPMRPLVTLSLDHLKNIKLIYDAFPNHIWCVSSATLGLHVWEKMPGPQKISLIQETNKAKLKRIGLAATEVHPMKGRPFRRPFGQDYYTITNDGLIEEWWRQLDYFENDAQTPTFDAIYQALRSLVLEGWSNYGYSRLAEPSAGNAHLRRYEVDRKRVRIGLLKEDLKVIDEWAGHGFPVEVPANDRRPAAGGNNGSDTATISLSPAGAGGPAGDSSASEWAHLRHRHECRL